MFRPILRTALLGASVFSMASCVNESTERERIVEATPMGMSFAKVLSYCKSRYPQCSSSESAGYLDQKTNKSVGVQSIWSVTGQHRYLVFFQATTSVYWGFDKDGKLIDVWVHNVTDAL
jgi:hypothetical protein